MWHLPASPPRLLSTLHSIFNAFPVMLMSLLSVAIPCTRAPHVQKGKTKNQRNAGAKKGNHLMPHQRRKRGQVAAAAAAAAAEAADGPQDLHLWCWHAGLGPRDAPRSPGAGDAQVSLLWWEIQTEVARMSFIFQSVCQCPPMTPPTPNRPSPPAREYIVIFGARLRSCRGEGIYLPWQIWMSRARFGAVFSPPHH